MYSIQAEKERKSHTKLCKEMNMLAPILSDNLENPLDLLQYLFVNKMDEHFSNLIVMLRIMLTLSLSVASGKRSFSKLKLIINYGRRCHKID